MNDELRTVWFIDHSKAVHDGLFLKNWEVVPIVTRILHEDCRLHGHFYRGKARYHINDGRTEVFLTKQDAEKELEKKLNRVTSEINKKQAAIARYYSNKATKKKKEPANDG